MRSLRQNLRKVAQMKWEKKLDLLSSIAFDLQLIHSHDIVHRDLHSCNILQDNIYDAYISDLGFATSVNKTLETESRKKIYGIMPYIAPEVLCGTSFTKASDVYSFGLIMWEISSGNVVFSEREDDSTLYLDIRNGLKPEIAKGTVLCYEDLLKKCWDADPVKRPSAPEIYNTIVSWKNKTELWKEFLEADMYNIHNATDDNIVQEHNTIYTSRIINIIDIESIVLMKHINIDHIDHTDHIDPQFFLDLRKYEPKFDCKPRGKTIHCRGGSAPGLELEYAFKKITDDKKRDLSQHVAILKELEDSEYIVRFYGIAVSSNELDYYFVTEWMENGNLRDYYTNYKLDWNKRFEFAIDICRGIAFLNAIGVYIILFNIISELFLY
ncbi:kinase-like domain-containing protein [Gigaspora rosea]|uniref:Kinase-like domain-containing protein n=1 Tax=Gigaspora rosea TaxID=44941 RepID=A0A397UYK9_9GLOM|nr:kinase-like domain-containing protein [Gigaspora rosea]